MPEFWEVPKNQPSLSVNECMCICAYVHTVLMECWYGKGQQ